MEDDATEPGAMVVITGLIRWSRLRVEDQVVKYKRSEGIFTNRERATPGFLVSTSSRRRWYVVTGDPT